MAPVLDLTPRVANILNAVFESPSDVTPVGESAADPSVTVENQSQDSQPKTAPVTSIDNEAEQRGFQSQMYRKDI